MSFPAPGMALSAAHGGRHWLLVQWRNIPCRDRALNESAAEHTRLPLAGIVEDTGLAGRHAMLAGGQFDLVAAIGGAQPRRLRRARRSHFYEELAAILGKRLADLAIADPVDVAQHNAAHAQGLARPDDDLSPRCIKPHHIEWR